MSVDNKIKIESTIKPKSDFLSDMSYNNVSELDFSENLQFNTKILNRDIPHIVNTQNDTILEQISFFKAENPTKIEPVTKIQKVTKLKSD